MNTNPQPDDFEQLRKLMALKRYEVPPPGYFHRFSGTVIARLQAPALEKPTWLQLLGLDFDMKPAFLCATGVAVCGLLSLGIIMATQIDTRAGSDVAEITPVQSPLEISMLNSPVATFGASRGVQRPQEVQSSTAPTSLFSQVSTVRVQPASFTFGGQ